jgi:hypothetical protein
LLLTIGKPAASTAAVVEATVNGLVPCATGGEMEVWAVLAVCASTAVTAAAAAAAAAELAIDDGLRPLDALFGLPA